MWKAATLSSALCGGAVAGFGISLIAACVGTLLEGILSMILVSWEMAGLIVPILSGIGGAVVGLVGGMIGKPALSGCAGALALGGAYAALVSNEMPLGVAVWFVVAGLLSGAGAGAWGGTRRQRFKKRQ